MPMDPLNTIHTYRSLAQSSLNELDAKPVKSSEDKKIISVLKKEIHNLEHEQKRLDSAKKVDNVFVRFLKIVGWTITSPIWIIPYAIKKLFVREKSSEERIQQIANNILKHLKMENLYKSLVSEVISYKGGVDKSNKDIMRLIFGLKEEGGPSDNLVEIDAGPVRMKQQFHKDLRRGTHLKIGNATDTKVEDEDGDLVALRRFESLKELMGEKELSVVSAFFGQAMMGKVNQNAYSKLNLYDENMKPLLKLNVLFDSYYMSGITLNPSEDKNRTMEAYVEGENVHVIFEQPFDIVTSGGEIKDGAQVVGHINVKREVIIPRSELRAVYDWMSDRESNTATNEDLMPNLRVIDTFSAVEKA